MLTSRRARLLTAPLATALLAGGALVLTAAPAGAVEVSTEAELRTAFDTASEVTLLTDITLTDCAQGDVERETSSDPVVLEGNGFTIRQTCPGERVLNVDTDSDVTLRNVTITGGDTSDDGGGYEHNGAGSLSIHSVTFADNTGCSEGGGVEVEFEVPVVVTNSTFSGNRSSDESAIDLDEGGDLTIVNSTFTGNIANNSGAIAAEDGDGDTVTLVYATVVGNVETSDECTTTGGAATGVEGSEAPEPEDVGTLDAGEPANVSLDGSYTLRAFGTVIADPIGTGSPTPNCQLVNPATESSGYNYSDDATCGFTAATDTQDGADPQLGALADNGGPTATMLPAATSPLVHAIPIDACGDGDGLAGFEVTTDQRGVARPQGPGCDIGAVELEVVAPAPVVLLEPRFTG